MPLRCLYREKGLDGVRGRDHTRCGLDTWRAVPALRVKDALAREACLRAFEWTITPLDGLSPRRRMARLQPDSARWCMAIFLRRIAITPERLPRCGIGSRCSKSGA
jgi:hypothetical protein